jgi:hypothetical protein
MATFNTTATQAQEKQAAILLPADLHRLPSNNFAVKQLRPENVNDMWHKLSVY